ncbi:MAG: terpene cyclase/mutase family protein, partial [Phycisphaerales bacterium]|nr:terpene cyclase/mutase family protein [Phycisphaerales bacterium]
AHYRKAQEMIDGSIAWLRAQQDPATGGWALPDDGPVFPAITGLVLTGMLHSQDIDGSDPTVARGIAFILRYQQPDGSIADRVVPSYNTSICLSALALVNTPEAAKAIGGAQTYLRGQQWSENSTGGDESGVVDRSHPFYGGIGYGSHGRPDGSNLNFMLQGLHDSGLDCDDEAFQRAVVFLERMQMDGRFNDMPYAKGSQQGGFI